MRSTPRGARGGTCGAVLFGRRRRLPLLCRLTCAEPSWCRVSSGAVPRNDPTDTGGLFIGRRPGTGPVHLRGTPERGGERRRRADGVLASLLLVAETLLCLSVWGPQPLAWLWIGSQADYRRGSHMLGIVVAFVGILASLFITLSLCVAAGPRVAAGAPRRGPRAARRRAGAHLRRHGGDRAGARSASGSW